MSGCVSYKTSIKRRVILNRRTPFKRSLLAFSLHQRKRVLHPLLTSAKTPIQRFIVARDQAYFKTMFFSGDRPSDLGQVKVSGILRFPNDVGFLFNHVWGKTLRDGDENVFGIRRNPHTSIPSIRGIEQYIEVARQMRVDLTRGYLFRPTTPTGGSCVCHVLSSHVCKTEYLIITHNAMHT